MFRIFTASQQKMYKHSIPLYRQVAFQRESCAANYTLNTFNSFLEHKFDALEHAQLVTVRGLGLPKVDKYLNTHVQSARMIYVGVHETQRHVHRYTSTVRSDIG